MKVENPLGGDPILLPVRLSIEEQMAIARLVAIKAPKEADRLAGLRVYREISGDAKVTEEGATRHILEVKIEQDKQDKTT